MSQLLAKATKGPIDGFLPVDLESARQKLGESTGDLDADISIALEAATSYCEEATGRVLRKTGKVTDSYAVWPGRLIGFLYNPVFAIDAVQYYAPDETALTTVSTDSYRLIESAHLGAQLEFDDGYTFPDYDIRRDAIQISYSAGYNDGPIDPRARQAILMLLPGFFDGMTGQVIENNNKMANALLQQLKWQLYQ